MEESRFDEIDNALKQLQVECAGNYRSLEQSIQALDLAQDHQEGIEAKLDQLLALAKQIVRLLEEPDIPVSATFTLDPSESQ
jgi:hypothetical protein